MLIFGTVISSLEVKVERINKYIIVFQTLISARCLLYCEKTLHSFL